MDAQELSELLDEYGIKHGPIVDSTRSLYEKKLTEAMAKGKKAKSSPDKTFYREEQDEVTYVHYRTPLRNEGFGDGDRPHINSVYGMASEVDYMNEPSLYRTEASYRNVSQSKPSPSRASSARSTKESSSPETRLIPLWFQILVFLVLAGFLYYVFTSMEAPPKNPFKKLE